METQTLQCGRGCTNWKGKPVVEYPREQWSEDGATCPKCMERNPRLQTRWALTRRLFPEIVLLKENGDKLQGNKLVDGQVKRLLSAEQYAALNKALGEEIYIPEVHTKKGLTKAEKEELQRLGFPEPKVFNLKPRVSESLLPSRKRKPTTDTTPHLTGVEKARRVISQEGLSWAYPAAPLRGYWRENGGTLHAIEYTESHYPATAVAEDEGLQLTVENVHMDPWRINQLLKDSPFESEAQMRKLLAAEVERLNIQFFTEDEVGFDMVPSFRKVPYVKSEQTAAAGD